MLFGTRVTLRALAPEDYVRLSQFKNDVEIVLLSDNQPPRPITLTQHADFLDESVKKEGVSFAIAADRMLIGECGLYHFDRFSGRAEVGITIGDRDYWGRGYGREALGLLIDYGFTKQNLRRIWLETDATNERAIGCYRAVGFVEEGRQREHVWINGRYVDVVLMGLLRADWTARRDSPAELAPCVEPS